MGGGLLHAWNPASPRDFVLVVTGVAPAVAMRYLRDPERAEC